jgi:hypothetical protein
MKFKLKNKRYTCLLFILFIIILVYLFFRSRKENFQSFYEKQIRIQNLKKKLKSLYQSKEKDKCLTEIECYNKLFKSLFNDFLTNLLDKVNPDSILTTTYSDDKKNGIIKMINEFKNTKDVSKQMIEKVNENNLSILLELADKLTKLTDDSDLLKKKNTFLKNYSLILTDIIPKKLFELNTNDFVNDHYKNSDPSTTVNYNSLMLASKEKQKGKIKEAPNIYENSYQEKKIKSIKDYFFSDFKDLFDKTKIVTIKSVAKLKLYDSKKLEENINTILESYKDADKVNSKIQKIKKELDTIVDDTEKWYCQNKNICVNS